MGEGWLDFGFWILEVFMSEKYQQMELEGRHPYAPLVGQVKLSVKVWAPGSVKEMNRRELDRPKPGAEPGWVSIAGFFNLQDAEEMHLLMGLLWDLEGMPMFPGSRTRRRSTYRVQEEGKNEVMVYLAGSEYHNSFSHRDVMQSDVGSLMAG